MRLLLCVLFCFLAANAHAKELRCEILEKYVCEVGGCKSIPSKVWNIINLSNYTYARCDSLGCDKYAAEHSQSGAFLNMALPKNGVTARITLGNNSFHETASLGHAVYISFGSCKQTD